MCYDCMFEVIHYFYYYNQLLFLKATALNRKLVSKMMMNYKQVETTSSSQTPLETVGEKQEAELDGCPILKYKLCTFFLEVVTENGHVEQGFPNFSAPDTQNNGARDWRPPLSPEVTVT